MNVKTGDMEIMVSSSMPENVSKIVRVGVWVPAGQHTLSVDGIEVKADVDGWLVESYKHDLAVRIVPFGKIYVNCGVCADWRLRPVSGIPDTEDTTTDTPIKELA